MGFGGRLARAAGDPWLGLVSALGGGLAWATAVPGALPVVIGAGMFGVGAVVGALVRDEDDGVPSYDDDPEVTVELRRGTEQAALVETLAAYVADLRELRSTTLPPSVVDPAIQGLVAAEGAQRTALRVAAAVDGLDTALQRSHRGPGQGVREAVARMAARRQGLLDRLRGTVDGVAEVYTRLLEMSATVSSLDVGDQALGEVEAVSASLDSLRTSLVALESERRALPS